MTWLDVNYTIFRESLCWPLKTWTRPLDDAAIILSNSTIRSSSLDRDSNDSDIVARDVRICFYSRTDVLLILQCIKIIEKILQGRKVWWRNSFWFENLHILLIYSYMCSRIIIFCKVFHVIYIILNRFSIYHLKYHNLFIKKI